MTSPAACGASTLTDTAKEPMWCSLIQKWPKLSRIRSRSMMPCGRFWQSQREPNVASVHDRSPWKLSQLRQLADRLSAQVRYRRFPAVIRQNADVDLARTGNSAEHVLI